MENFVLELDGLLSKEYCDEVIEYYHNMEKGGFVADRSTVQQNAKKHLIDDSNTGFVGEYSVKLESTQRLSSIFLESFWKMAYPMYVNKYSVIQDADPHKIFTVKLQKSTIGQGYHIWHFENSSRQNSNRLLNFIFYLNDVEEGGETEFLYFPKRVKAQTGKLILFPCSFTHTHRGNPPISNEKYILTGWVEF